MAVKKHLIFIALVLCWNLAVSQHWESSVTDIFHPHKFNPALRIESDTMEIKYFGNFYNNSSNSYLLKTSSNVFEFEILVPKINTVIGFQTGIEHTNYEFYECCFPLIYTNFKKTDIPVSLFFNTEIVNNLYAGAEIEYTYVETQKHNTKTDSLISSMQDYHWDYGFGLSYTPGNFIIGIYYGQEDAGNGSSIIRANAGYMKDMGKFELLFLGTYSSESFNSVIINTRISYDETVFIALMAKENVSRLTNASSTQYGFALGGSVFDSRLMFGIGINKTIYSRNWFYSPFLIYSL